MKRLSHLRFELLSRSCETEARNHRLLDLKSWIVHQICSFLKSNLENAKKNGWSIRVIIQQFCIYRWSFLRHCQGNQQNPRHCTIQAVYHHGGITKLVLCFSLKNMEGLCLQVRERFSSPVAWSCCKFKKEKGKSCCSLRVNYIFFFNVMNGNHCFALK